jgi:D-alanine-D-alanine ligase
MMEKMKVAVVVGGDSLEAASSLASGAYIFDHLSRRQYQRLLIRLEAGRWALLKADGLTAEQLREAASVPEPFGFVFPDTPGELTVDCIILAIHGKPAETGQLQGYLDLVGIPYTGPGVFAAALSMHKFACKEYLRNLLACHFPKHLLYGSVQEVAIDAIEQTLGYPCIIKPNREGSGIGVNLAINRSGLHQALSDPGLLQGPVLAEEYISGRELTAAVICLQEGPRVLPVAEVYRPEGNASPTQNENRRQFTNRQGASLTLPASLPENLLDSIRALALQTGQLLGLNSFYRLDLMLSASQQLYFLEVNSIPGLAARSVFTRQLAAASLSLPRVLDQWISTAIHARSTAVRRTAIGKPARQVAEQQMGQGDMAKGIRNGRSQ